MNREEIIENIKKARLQNDYAALKAYVSIIEKIDERVTNVNDSIGHSGANNPQFGCWEEDYNNDD